MRHFKYIILATLVIVSVGWNNTLAREVNKTEATAIAMRFLSSNSVRNIDSGFDLETKSGMYAPAFHIFKDESSGQWVIISGEDCTTPIIAHGYGQIDGNHLPENMRFYLLGISRDITRLRSSKVQQSGEVASMWKNVGVMTKATLTQKLLETAEWGQGNPYNILCPILPGESVHSYTGCLATAMAIVIHYNKWPVKGYGVIPSYEIRDKNVSIPAIDATGYEYDYNNMPLKGGASWLYPQQVAVATLMLHCGASVQMEYGPLSSGAVGEKVINAMVTYMGYSPKGKLLARERYSNNEWMDFIREDIDAGFPIIYAGANGDNAHAFVCDGYNSNNEVHINWGWEGSWNGWFAICNLGETNMPSYNRHDYACFGLRPYPEGEEPIDMFAEIAFPLNSGIELSGGKIEKGSSFALKVGKFGNYNIMGESYKGSIRFALFDKDGKMKEFVSQEITGDPIASYGAVTLNNAISCTINCDVQLGDYISLCYQSPDDKWLQLGASRDFEYGQYSVNKIGVYDYDIIQVPLELNDGEKYYPSLLFGQRKPDTLFWYYDGSPIPKGKEYVTLTKGEHVIKAVITYKDKTVKTVIKRIEVK